MKTIHKDIVFVGDGMVGKTCILHTFIKGFCLRRHIPTILNKDTIDIELDGKLYNVTFNDTAGQEEYQHIRLLSYKNIDAIILCYSSTERITFENIMQKWLPEIKLAAPNAPIVLVASKIDLRDNASSSSRKTLTITTTKDGERLRKKIKATSFIECSAVQITNIDEVIYEAIRVSDRPVDVEEERKHCLCTRFTNLFKQYI